MRVGGYCAPFYYHVAAKVQVIEEPIQLEVLSANFDRHLAADKGAAHAHLQQEQAQMREQAPFQIASVRGARKRQKGKVVQILQELLCKIGFRRRRSSSKVGCRLALPTA